MNEFQTIYKKESLLVEINSIKELSSITLINFVKLNGACIKKFSINQKIEKKHVVVIGGGASSERKISYMSSNGIVCSIIELGYHLTFVDMGTDIALVLNKLKPDIVYNALHGMYGEDGFLPGLLNIMHIPYTGSGVLASSIAFNKKISYKILKSHGIKIAENKIIKKTDCCVIDPFRRPYVIKPISQGSSIGVEIIFTEDKFSFDKYNFPYGDEVLVEQYIKGREMQVAVLNGRAIGVLEIKLLQGKRFYDYETKYTKGFAEYLLPAPVTTKICNDIKKLAEEVYYIFGCRGLVRIEMIYSSDNKELYILEVNTHPGMTPFSICSKIATLEHMSYNNLVKEILGKSRFE